MQRLLPNKARFYLLIFTGRPQTTRQRLQDLRGRYEQLQLDRSLVEAITVVGAEGDSALDAMLGVESFGRTYYDASLQAHNVYEVDPDTGGMFVIRPDGYLGAVLGLEEDQSIVNRWPPLDSCQWQSGPVSKQIRQWTLKRKGKPVRTS